jgi:hypothetical protein
LLTVHDFLRLFLTFHVQKGFLHDSPMLRNSANVFLQQSAVPEFIGPVFAKTSPKRTFSLTEKECFGLVFAKTGSIISGTWQEGILYSNVLYKLAIT